MVFFGGLVVKNLSANEGDSGSTPGWADPLEKEMATHSSILARKSHAYYSGLAYYSPRAHTAGHNLETNWAYKDAI